MIEIASNGPYDLSFFNSLPSVETLAETYLRELSARNTEKARGLLEKTNLALAQAFERFQRVSDMIRHFRSLTPKPPEVFEVPEFLPVRDSVQQVLRAMQYEFPMEKMTILKIIPQDLSPSPIPRELLEMVLFQLIFNARQSVGEVSGIITIEAAEKVTLSSENQSKRRFLLRVSDTGPGIPEFYLEHLFDPFFITENYSRLNGVGLCLVKKIADFYRGLVRVETSIMGTSYFVEFPQS